MNYTLIATSTFGLEKVVAEELSELGYEDHKIENGKVIFEGDETAIVTCNMWLRTADRVLLRMAEFKAMDFEELFQGVKAVKWEDIIPVNGIMHVTGKSINSKLSSVPDCQSIVKKAVVEAMKRKYKIEKFPENGPTYQIEVALLKDVATITLDTTGPGLHKRGYREFAGEAPLKETLAAALVLLSRWKPEKPMADPMCGSGTIAIEAAMIGKNIAPGLNRSFVSEQWDWIPKRLWEDHRQFAKKAVNKKEFNILASDILEGPLRIARMNAERAGVADCITFRKLDVKDFTSREKYGWLISNPPYGERMGSAEEAEKLTRTLGEVCRKLDTWSFYIISSFPDFEKVFGKKASKNRKLYNGRIQCYYYQFYGPKPERSPAEPK